MYVGNITLPCIQHIAMRNLNWFAKGAQREQLLVPELPIVFYAMFKLHITTVDLQHPFSWYNMKSGISLCAPTCGGNLQDGYDIK